MTASRKLVAAGAGAVLAVVLITVYLTQWLTVSPPSVASATRNGEAQLTIQTVASLGTAPHPDWVSYLVKDARGRWVHTTLMRLPAHSTVHVTIYQYDTATGLRNPFWAQPQGVVGRTMTLDGKTIAALDPDLASHTFAVPDLGVSVPLAGVADDAKNQCSVAPCTLAEAHRTITFSFHTGAPGRYRWQCFVPCGAGFLFGFGGPMQTVGYMDGFLLVA
ncbi:MAG: hypothetical protein QOG59_3722 [Solirubrobacteraceae bacterium]|nr:hypothetical protein [Solirubrobacteraceae bacterium]